MPRRIDKRWMLAVLVTATQLCLLVAGSLWLASWLEATVTAVVRQRLAASVGRLADQTAALIDGFGLDAAAPGSAGRRGLEEVVERVELPADAFTCLIDDAGRIVHPRDLARRPELSGLDLGAVALTGPDGRLDLGSIRTAAAPVTGRAELPDGSHLVAVRDLPGPGGGRLVALQSDRGVQIVIDEFVDRTRAITITFSIVIVSLSTALTVLIMHRYDNRLAAINTDLGEQVALRSRALLKTRDAVIFGLARLAESRDDDTGRHLDRIRRYVEILADELARRAPDLDRDMLEVLGPTSSLHDIGKVGVADAILLKPGPLSGLEREQMQRHTTIGGDCLLDLRRRWGKDPFLVTACQIAFHHHERWDGRGYPFGLAGPDIPLPARIVALADVYDALTTERVYKKALSHDEARKIILEDSEGHFDPQVVEAFLARQDEFRAVLAEGD